jgi:hypothetical protein
MEKLVDSHIRDGVLKECPLHWNQHAYQNGKSIKTAFHNAVICIVSATEYKKLALAAFLDLEEAFDRTSFDVITQAAERHGTEPTICRWIRSMLESRNITTTLLGEPLRASTKRKCLQMCAFASAVKPGCGRTSMGA